MTIGERVSVRRKELGMTQEELAQKLGYSGRSSITKIEKGVQQLTQSKIKQIANALDTTTDYIMGWDAKSDRYSDLLRYCEVLTDEDLETVQALAKRLSEYQRKLGDISK